MTAPVNKKIIEFLNNIKFPTYENYFFKFEKHDKEKAQLFLITNFSQLNNIINNIDNHLQIKSKL